MVKVVLPMLSGVMVAMAVMAMLKRRRGGDSGASAIEAEAVRDAALTARGARPAVRVQAVG